MTDDILFVHEEPMECKKEIISFEIGDSVTDPIYRYPTGIIKRFSDNGKVAWVEWHAGERPLPICAYRLKIVNQI